jgi:hypothetical protein
VDWLLTLRAKRAVRQIERAAEKAELKKRLDLLETDTFFEEVLQEFKKEPTPALSKLDGGTHERAFHRYIRVLRP